MLPWRLRAKTESEEAGPPALGGQALLLSHGHSSTQQRPQSRWLLRQQIIQVLHRTVDALLEVKKKESSFLSFNPQNQDRGPRPAPTANCQRALSVRNSIGDTRNVLKC